LSLVGNAHSRTLMRSIVGIALVLVGLGLVSCQLDGRLVAARRTTPDAAWVRTIDGWERTGNWTPVDSRRPPLHPLVVASGQLLLSVFALAAFAGNSARRF
jgi:hypothetical protein